MLDKTTLALVHPRLLFRLPSEMKQEINLEVFQLLRHKFCYLPRLSRKKIAAHFAISLTSFSSPVSTLLINPEECFFLSFFSIVIRKNVTANAAALLTLHLLLRFLRVIFRSTRRFSVMPTKKKKFCFRDLSAKKLLQLE